MEFRFPVDGDCVNSRDGTVKDGVLWLDVSVCAPAGHDISVNGILAAYDGGLYHTSVPVYGYRNSLLAADHTDGTKCRIAVFSLPDAVGRFRLSSDDNILFLADITAHADTYTSIFDNPYLALYKKAHERYGAKVHLNLFYEYIPTGTFSDPGRAYFNLSMMTDRFREEFTANSGWLKLAFHARSEFPDRPYQHASAGTITEDCARVCREIIRFAGPACISNTTTVHWGEANRECVRALRSLGFRTLTGYFDRMTDGTPLVAYYTDGALLDHIYGRDFWMDTEEDMLFGRIDLVLNSGTYDRVMQQIAEITADPHRGGFVSVMIHEQYFYADYRNYLSDYTDRVLDVCAFLQEKGYTGAHICDVTAERDLREHPLFQ